MTKAVYRRPRAGIARKTQKISTATSYQRQLRVLFETWIEHISLSFETDTRLIVGSAGAHVGNTGWGSDPSADCPVVDSELVVGESTCPLSAKKVPKPRGRI
jgi:CRISPR/Cas system CMR subunit Cmr6 (Cas7 group RAMP superfamily)